jgi:hypothetical protein
MRLHRHAHPSLDRRTFLKGASVTAVAGAAAPLLGMAPAGASEARSGSRAAVLPTPIPGGIDLGDGNVIHVWAPGPTSVTLPFTGGTLGGEDVEPATITDFEGVSAVAFHVGTAKGSNGVTYNLETDMRAYKGRYVGVDGEVHEGSFGFV